MDPARPTSFIDRLPGVWRGRDWADAAPAALPSGHAVLDAELPGGGWPVGALSEVLQPAGAHHEWRLVLPALAARLQERDCRAVLVAPPLEPFAPALQAAGVRPERLYSLEAQESAAAWACEQALRCREVGAVLAWLPRALPATLRRLQLAAAQQRQLLWVFRPLQAGRNPSPAPLRLGVQGQGGRMLVHVLKRRGPPLDDPLELAALPALLERALRAQASRRLQVQRWPVEASPPAGRPGAAQEVAHALAGVAAAG